MAHNEQAAANLARDLAAIPCAGRTLCVFGCFADKDLDAMLRELGGAVDRWFPTRPGGARDLAADVLAAELAARGYAAAEPAATPATALNLARAGARPGDRILVTGSFLMVAGALQFIGEAAGPMGL